VGMARTASGQGYWFVATDGGIFSFGDAKFYGSTGALKLNRPVVGMAAAPYSPVTAPDFVFTLSGTREVSASASATGDPDGDGIVFMDFTDDELCYTIEVDGITLPPTAAHIHEAPEGVAGDVFLTLKTPDNEGFAEECVAMDKTKIAQILAHPQRFYVNVHNADYPNGAVRGQLADELLVAMTSANKVVAFFSSAPEDLVLDPTPLTGIGAGETIVGGDVRPRTLDGYFVTKDASNVGRVYKVDPNLTATGFAATRVGTTDFTLGTGMAYGVDFDPVDDVLRIVSDADLNGTFDLATGAFTVETSLNPPDPAVTGIAYSNNVPGTPQPTTTTLYDFDTNTGFLFTQVEATGTLTPVGDTGLTVDPAEATGLDIGLGPDGKAAPMFLVTRLTGNEFFTVYAVNPANAVVTKMGDVGDKTITTIIGAAIDVS
jgi:hypothetical protein